MNERLDGLRHEYLSALRDYLEKRDETALSAAYELGRRAMIEGSGLLEMTTLHRAGLQQLLSSAPPAEHAGLVEAASSFFYELLSPFEMSLAGYRVANDELRRLNETLREQKEVVESINKELESFSYSVSHDLRAPLRSIDGFSQILVEDFADALDESGKKYLGYIRTGAQEMAKLIDDLLGLARVTRTEIHRADVDLTALVHRIAERLRTTAPERTVAFDVEENVHAKGDPRLIAVVFENLLGNAWKFTSKRERAVIQFGTGVHQGVPHYFVRDNGAGFDMSYAAKLFGAFQRLHSATEFEGTGIGLATVQRIIHRHGGQVWAEGKPGEGASFYFTLEPRPRP
jgi:light-regulated signal transduction histidine kinase (bacteriophytochrome)